MPEPVLDPVRDGDRREPLLKPEEVTGLVARLKTVLAAVASRLERSTTGRMAGCCARRSTWPRPRSCSARRPWRPMSRAWSWSRRTTVMARLL
jgi:hypothetical protein